VRRAGSSPLANPVLIGAVTILVVIVAIFLSYNANSGLPFVPTYQLNVDVPSAAQLVKGNEVRIGGSRVGAIADIRPKTLDNGRTIATLELKLDKAVEELPTDSTILIRSKSLLGLKYVEITRGDAEEGYEAGATVPLSASREQPVEFDEFVDTFDAKTREGIARSTLGIGTALAGRGESINTAIGAFRPLLEDLLPVARYLRDPETGLARFIRALGQSAAEVAPVAESQARLFVGGARTFEALAEVARPFIQETIEEGPETLETAIRSFRVQRPFLENSTRLVAELRPGVSALRGAAPELSEALRVGRPVLLRTAPFAGRLEDLLLSLEDFATDDVVPRGVEDLTITAKALRPTLSFLAPAQTTCNYVANWFRNVSDLLSVGDASGTTQRFIIIATPPGPNNEGGPSSDEASGPNEDNYLHFNPYPNTAAPGQPKECEAGNEPYIPGRVVIGNVPGTQPARTDGNP
jgi:ABC-type transporter Mla subunit MlaD